MEALVSFLAQMLAPIFSGVLDRFFYGKPEGQESNLNDPAGSGA
jgi:hypothetical protein